jgi:hypothetical protein
MKGYDWREGLELSRELCLPCGNFKVCKFYCDDYLALADERGYVLDARHPESWRMTRSV